MPVQYFTEEEYNILERKANTLYSLVSKIAQMREEHYNQKDDFYPYIPNGIGKVLRLFTIAKDHLGKNIYDSSFLDVGAGIGIIVELAKSFGFKGHGIEIEQKYIDEYKNIFYNKRYHNDRISTSITKHNALKYKGYHRYDVIYYYVPIRTEKIEAVLEKKIENDMKVGAILIPCHKVDRDIYDDKRFKRLVDGYSIFKKVRK